MLATARLALRDVWTQDSQKGFVKNPCNRTADPNANALMQRKIGVAVTATYFIDSNVGEQEVRELQESDHDRFK